MTDKNHELMKDKVLALYDGELSTAESKEAQAHLESCTECSQAYEKWEKTAKLFFKGIKSEASEAFVFRVMERVEALESPRKSRPWVITLRWLAPAVGVLGILSLVMGQVEQTVSVENLLLNNVDASSPSALLFANKPAATDEALGLIMEGNI